ncbi:ATP-dependent Clp protease adaptor ClpS [Campylobacter sp. JMF_01 NE2]|uniref:ATP-dependent Clp protease adaptor ClpS n=1 Tax=unclassified Campylobacter TaxID=2593542 RepID=UPI0022E9EC04|nr:MULTISPECIES: ATP-dependent Clp protease adaptor ClpS [unclassified Campylobacter]MDA3043514.1 ATP-dependent Clp protease adaptor ClpS [Campylobacter sp. JMF_09 ED2]MDA3044463.1 ATP-dependent Clp protease adaptor ClpS [Campylobacter sp. JMF_07 ED4]MDA3051360.1 ATP-dependent Clp protease adaptor ClpS [Campylobacter sp. JMF_02 ED1]MDA3052605.1 ATP-dependent Clp protease adaptor ClpS [Campylobacter sp. JMF_03 NE3]MDA3054020.1 ATP-dependent Clp protease adaptor ClpS [Campylobacter sp. VBCF_07 N
MATQTSTKVRVKTFKPSPYRVVLLNDDVTPMDFVVIILIEIFAHTTQNAVKIMLNVHKNGRGICGVYAKEIAKSKQEAVLEAAAREGFPLKCIIEEDK